MIIQALAQVREVVKSYVDQKLATMFQWSLIGGVSAMGDKDSVQTADGEKSQRPVQRIEPWGLRGVPAPKVRALCIRLGSSTVFFIGIQPTSGYGPTDLNPGETALWNAVAGCDVRLLQDGAIDINRGANGAARLNDNVDQSTDMATWMTSVSTALSIATVPTTIGKISSASTKTRIG